jgi:hypothetical protein
MRALSIRDKNEAQVKVVNGGKSVTNLLRILAYYHVSLNLPPDEFFRQEQGTSLQDGKAPVLLLHKRLE